MTPQRVERWRTIEKMWNEEAYVDEIAEVLGQPYNSVLVDISLMRMADWDVPYRNRQPQARGGGAPVESEHQIPRGISRKRYERWFVVRDMWQDGYTASSIAEVAGTSRAVISQDILMMRMNGWGLAYRNKTAVPLQQRCAAVVAHLREHGPARECHLARALDIDGSTVAKACRRLAEKGSIRSQPGRVLAVGEPWGHIWELCP